MIFRQFLTASTGCASYLLGCAGHGCAAIVDPGQDIEQYIDLAQRYGLKINAIVDTHIHADHISGERQLAQRTGAPVYLHRSAKVAFPFTPVEDGSELALGNVVIKCFTRPDTRPKASRCS